MGNKMTLLLSFTKALLLRLFCQLCRITEGNLFTILRQKESCYDESKLFLRAKSFSSLIERRWLAEASAETLKLAIITSEV